MHQLKILLAQELRFRRSCSASGSRAPSSVIGRARPCSLCPNSLSPTPAPHTGPFPPGFSMAPTCNESPLTAPSPSKTPSAPPRFGWRVPAAARNPSWVEHWDAARSAARIWLLRLTSPRWTRPHGCFSADTCRFGAGGERGTQSPADARRARCFDRCLRTPHPLTRLTASCSKC